MSQAAYTKKASNLVYFNLAVPISTDLKFLERTSFGLPSAARTSPGRYRGSFRNHGQPNFADTEQTVCKFLSEVEPFFCQPYRQDMKVFSSNRPHAF